MRIQGQGFCSPPSGSWPMRRASQLVSPLTFPRGVALDAPAAQRDLTQGRIAPLDPVLDGFAQATVEHDGALAQTLELGSESIRGRR